MPAATPTFSDSALPRIGIETLVNGNARTASLSPAPSLPTINAARCANEAELRDVRYSFRPDALRATGHTLSDQVETVLFRLVSSGSNFEQEVARFRYRGNA